MIYALTHTHTVLAERLAGGGEGRGGIRNATTSTTATWRRGAAGQRSQFPLGADLVNIVAGNKRGDHAGNMQRSGSAAAAAAALSRLVLRVKLTIY